MRLNRRVREVTWTPRLAYMLKNKQALEVERDAQGAVLVRVETGWIGLQKRLKVSHNIRHVLGILALRLRKLKVVLKID